jgi:prepilin-type N-terminal cleavage/methylation domain-containing protein
MQRRSGVTLVELMLVVAIIAVLVALLIPAVMSMRAAAVRLESQNKLRQITLALHHYASVNRDTLPSVAGPLTPSVFGALLPYVEQGNLLQAMQGKRFFPIALYLSPADPTVAQAMAEEIEVGSYAANARVFVKQPRLSSSFQDGTSNTIVFAEHYAHCGNTYFLALLSNSGIGLHRATFADDTDVVPVTNGNPPVSLPSFGQVTFQVAPAPKDCDPAIPQTPHSSGMLAALGDASVRSLAPGMSPATFWGAVTPAKGEQLGDDW